MKIPSLALFVCCGTLLLSGVPRLEADYGKLVEPGELARMEFTNIPEAERVQIEAALPEKAQAQPARPRKVLVFNLTVRKGVIMTGHPSVPYTNYAIQRMGERTGAYSVTFSNDPAVFRAETLGAFDAVIFNNTAGVLTDDPELRQGLLDYVFTGGGFAGTHAAGATFCQWPDYTIFPEFGEMLGGFESGGHPWGPEEWISLRMDDPGHPVAAAFGGKNFEVSDEVFQFTEPYSRNRLRVLLGIDPERTDMDPKRRILPERLADRDIAISWVKRYGRGRVFYTSLGHNVHLAWNPEVMRHYLDGIQFALGDLPGPTTPSAKLRPAERARERLGWRFGPAAYTFKNQTFFETIEKADALGMAWVGGLNVQTVSAGIPKKLDPSLTDAEIRQVRQHLVRHGVTLLSYYHFDLPAEEAACRRIFEFGKKLGIETFIAEPKPEALDLVERLCEEYQIKVAIHNHGPRLSPVYWRPEGVLAACAGRSPLLGSACDLGHWAKEGIDGLEAIRLLGPRVITLQMHDASEMGAQGHDVPWGTGVIDLEGILRHLKKEKINPVMFELEYSYNWDHSEPELRQSAEWFDAQALALAGEEQKEGGK